MRRPWFKQPRQLANDPRYVLLSLEGAFAYHTTYLFADDDGILSAVGGRDAVGTLAEVISARRPDADIAWAIDAVRESVDAGLLEESADGNVLRIVDWVEDVQGSAGARPPVLSADGHVAAMATAAAAKRGPGRPRLGETPLTATERKERARFNAREGRYRDVPQGVTWEQWRAKNPAAKPSEDGRETPPRNSDTPRNPAAKPRRETPVGGRASSGETEKRGEEEGEGTPERAPPPAAKPRHETPSVVRCVAVEDSGLLDADVVLDQMAVASEGRLSMKRTSEMTAKFAKVAGDLIGRGQTSREGLVLAARHARHFPWFQTRSEPIGLDRLLDPDGALLVELLTKSEACVDCGGVPLPTTSDASPNFEDASIEAARRSYCSNPTQGVA